MSKISPAFVLSFYAVFSLTSMGGMNTSFLLVFLAFLYFGFVQKKISWPTLLQLEEYKKYTIAGGYLFVACLLSLIVAKIFPVIYADHAPDITAHGFLKIWYLLCPGVLAALFLASSSLRQSLEKITKAWWITTILLSLIAIIQFYTGWPLKQVIPTNPDHYHAILFFGHHLSTSSIIIFPTFAALAIVIGSWTRTKELPKLEAIASVAGILILFLSYARTAWLAIPLGIVLVFLRYFKSKTLIKGVSVLLVIIGGLSQTSLLKERIENGMGINSRLELWKANIDFFKHNPFTGIGWLKTQEMSEFYFKQLNPEHYHDYFWGHAHSNFFEMLGGTGIIGLIAFFIWSYFTLKLAYQTSKRAKAVQLDWIADFSWGLGVALLLLHFNGLTNVTFWEGKVMHQQMFAIGLLLMVNLLIKRTRGGVEAQNE